MIPRVRPWTCTVRDGARVVHCRTVFTINRRFARWIFLEVAPQYRAPIYRNDLTLTVGRRKLGTT